MNLIDIILVLISNALFVVNQVVVKYWLINRSIVLWPLNIKFVKNIFSIEIFIAVISFGISAYIWMILLKKIDISLLYPMVSIAYIFSIFAGALFFKEHISLYRWIGVIVIIIGTLIINKS